MTTPMENSTLLQSEGSAPGSKKSNVRVGQEAVNTSQEMTTANDISQLNGGVSNMTGFSSMMDEFDDDERYIDYEG